MKLKSDITLPFHLQPHIYFTACAMCGLDDRYFQCVRADLHGTIFVSCDKLTTGLRHDLRLGCTSEKCRSILKHVLKRCSNRKSCRRPAVSLSHGSNYPMIDLSQQTKTFVQIHTRTYLSSIKNLCVREETKWEVGSLHERIYA